MPKTYNFHKEHKYSDFREIICTSAERFANRTVFEVKEDDGSKTNITYAQLKELYYGLCIKFIKMGYLGKRIAVTGKNCHEWGLAYLCAATVGVVVPIDKELQA